jgi:hypothetical protein
MTANHVAAGRTNRRFDEADIIAIRTWAAFGTTLAELGRRYGVTRSAIVYIVKGRSYPDFGGPIRGQSCD